MAKARPRWARPELATALRAELGGNSPGHGDRDEDVSAVRAVFDLSYCAQQGLAICNGNTIDDRKRCHNKACARYSIYDRISLNNG
jgi:hypothetical protein